MRVVAVVAAVVLFNRIIKRKSKTATIERYYNRVFEKFANEITTKGTAARVLSVYNKQ